ncbi:NADH:ubiquinone reductase (Na(+)-transporting) subunit F [Fidelibacter multiformis]|uniref:NADH:ubiquinone reductase (Na(+)-transporting) subunit F n=1 Tax=Fidelibacter multiformis TaxID=3377529 RepID=UPI0037DD89E9
MTTLGVLLISTLVFVGMIVVLVLILIAAESKLVYKGDVKITINENEEKSITVPAGKTLLNTLSDQKIFLPSACGGGGTCAMCKCQILEGGGEILPTETSHFSYREQKDNWRLSCQVKVKNDMSIRIPEEIFNIQKYTCTVASNKNVATFIKELVMDLDENQRLDFRSGGYIQIDIPEYELSFKDFDIDERFREDWEKYNLFDLQVKNPEPVFRAYSMANHPAEGQKVILNVRIATPPRGMDVPPGIASSWIFNLKPGDKVTISGPYGEFYIKDTDREMCFIGGGAGMAPMRSHIFHLFHTEKTKRKATFWYGARSKREMFYDEEFKAIAKEHPNFSYHVALSDPLPEDKWDGPVGFIHQVAFDEYLSKHEDPSEIEYYLCGPPMMLDAVQKMLYNLGVDEENIAFDDFG